MNSSLLHLSHFILTTSETGSSQSVFSRHRSCRIFFPSRRSGATKPKGSYMELTVESIPLLVHGRSFNVILNWNESFSTHHSTPRVRSIGRASVSKSMFLISSALSSAGMASITSFLFEANLCRRKPPLRHISLASLIRFTASSDEATDLRPSST